RLFHIILEYLKVQDEVDSERILKDIAAALPYDNPERILETMIAWGRYAGLMDYNANTKMVFIPKDDDEATEE
ncbi:MAG: AAA-associated domain-containing protein, partial [Chthoniobacteraceae bacterium]